MLKALDGVACAQYVIDKVFDAAWPHAYLIEVRITTPVTAGFWPWLEPLSVRKC